MKPPLVVTTPDGTSVIYHAIVRDTIQLMRRPIDSLVATPIAGTERGVNPAISPDGQRIAFFADGAIKTVPICPLCSEQFVFGFALPIGSALPDVAHEL